jgi:hypothetical protein
MSDLLKYQQSIAAEFEAIRDRVEFFIGSAHWGEVGRYKEVILMNYLRKIIPNSVSVGTGFVKNAEGELTSQIDIILYKTDSPKLFSEGEFVILMPESVVGIIEVKSTSTSSVLTRQNNGISTLTKAEKNGRIIGNKDIFNGIFAFDNGINLNEHFKDSTTGQQLSTLGGYLNHLALGSNNFIRFWDTGNPTGDGRPCYSAYHLSFERVTGKIEENRQGFSFGYFFSNLLEYIYRQTAPEMLNQQYFEFLYPIEGTKEVHRVTNGNIFIVGE